MAQAGIVINVVLARVQPVAHPAARRRPRAGWAAAAAAGLRAWRRSSRSACSSCWVCPRCGLLGWLFDPALRLMAGRDQRLVRVPGMSGTVQNRRVLSGMRPTGQLHLGNYHGALKNWIELQYQYECYFFIADWHALTTGYEDTSKLEEYVWTMAIDWLAAGLNPGVATLFIQSKVPEHAELHLLLSMITPLGWLERVPVLQGPAGSTRRPGPRHLRLSRLSVAAIARIFCCTARNTCRWARIRSHTWKSRARWHGASITSTAASLNSNRKWKKPSRAWDRAIPRCTAPCARSFRRRAMPRPWRRRGRWSNRMRG